MQFDQECRNILVVLPNWVGDVVMATPVLRALRAHHRQARITYLGPQSSLDVLSPLKWADSAVADLSRRRPKRLANFFRTANRLRKDRFDLAILMPNSFRSAILTKLSACQQIAGYDRDGRGWLLTDRLAPKRDAQGRFVAMPTLQYYRDLAQFTGVPVDDMRMELPVDEAHERSAGNLLAEMGADAARPIVMLNPGAAFGPSKMWEPPHYGALADMLIEQRGAQIIINAAPNERHIAAQVQAHMRHAPLLSFAQRDNSIGLLKALLARCDLLVTNDTGPRHIGAALGIGVVTVFGSTDPRWAQIDYPRERVVRLDVSCSPCQSKLCLQVPGPSYHQCMSAITPQQVALPSLELLDSAAKPTGVRP